MRRIARKLRLVSKNIINTSIGTISIIIERGIGIILLLIGLALCSSAVTWFFTVPVADTKSGQYSSPVANSEQLITLAKECPADVGFYGKNLTTGRTVEYQADKPACLASIVKLFVLAEVMRQAHQNELKLSESLTIKRGSGEEISTVAEALDKMIRQSDNEATNALAARVGFDHVNALPEKLGIEGLSTSILPGPGVLEKILDERVFNKQHLDKDELLPQHGTARGMTVFFERLHDGNLINEQVSDMVLTVLDRNPKPFAPARPVSFQSVGKGGSIVWERIVRQQYNMVGWALYIHSESEAIALCIWFEWFPRLVKDPDRQLWYDAISNGIVHLLLGDADAEEPVTDVPNYVLTAELLDCNDGTEAWEELLKNGDFKAFVKSAKDCRISNVTAFNAKIIPMVVCHNVPTTAHFTWRWHNPDGLYQASEVEFAPGWLWGWMPMVHLDRQGPWRFEIGCNGRKIFDREILVEKQKKDDSL